MMREQRRNGKDAVHSSLHVLARSGPVCMNCAAGCSALVALLWAEARAHIALDPCSMLCSIVHIGCLGQCNDVLHSGLFCFFPEI